MKQTKTNGQATAQKANNERTDIYRFELWSTRTKKIERTRCALTFYGVTEERATAAAIGMVIGLKEKYASPKVLVYRQNADGTETLYREQF